MKKLFMLLAIAIFFIACKSKAVTENSTTMDDTPSEMGADPMMDADSTAGTTHIAGDQEPGPQSTTQDTNASKPQKY